MPRKITTTDATLLRLIKQATGGEDGCAAKHAELIKGIDKKLDDMCTVIGELDEAIRGNGDPGLKEQARTLKTRMEAQEAAMKDHTEHHRQKHIKADLDYKWKIGIVAAILAPAVALALGLYAIMTEENRQRETAKTIINEYIRSLDSLVIPPPKPKD